MLTNIDLSWTADSNKIMCDNDVNEILKHGKQLIKLRISDGVGLSKEMTNMLKDRFVTF